MTSFGDLPYRSTEEFKNLKKFSPNVIIVALGTNDTKPQNWKGIEAFEAEYMSLLEDLENFEYTSKIWVCLPPPVYIDTWGINQKTLIEIIHGIKSVCAKKNIPIIDLNDALSENPSLFPDGIHPND